MALYKQCISALRVNTAKNRNTLKIAKWGLQCTCNQSRTFTSANITIGNYGDLHKRSISEPEVFWDEVAQSVEWFRPYSKVLDNSKPPFTKWFIGGQLNTCYNAVDRHVNSGKGDQLAIIHDSPVTNSVKKITFKELQNEVSLLAGGLSRLGVGKGDRVLIYMPMIPEAVISMLATVRLGAIHSVVFGGFAARELATRVNHLKPSIILTASFGVEPSRLVNYKPMIDEAIEISHHKPKHCVIYQRPNFDDVSLVKERDISWHDLMTTAPHHDAVPVDSNDPCYVLYTSGTTGDPKGIVRPSGGHAAVLPWTMSAIYGLNSSDVWWAASDLGWVVGHSYICYAPLFNGNTTIVYEGKPIGTPDSGQFFRVIQDHKIKGMFTAPTALRAIKGEDPTAVEGKKYDISSLKYLFVAGEPLDYETRVWAEEHFEVPVLDNWWQTETGYAITANAVGMNMPLNPPRNASGKPFPGFDLSVLREDGKIAEPNELGRIVSKLPLPPGCMTTLYEAPARFVDTYFTEYPGYYDSMDAGIYDNEGYIYVLSRDDDVINVAGHRFSTIALEEAVLDHPDIVDTAVVGVSDSLKGEVPLALFVLKKNCNRSEEDVSKELVILMRKLVGPVAAFRLSAQVRGLPRTRSGKTARKSIADLARNKSIKISPTIEDASVYTDILEALRRCGCALETSLPVIPSK